MKINSFFSRIYDLFRYNIPWFFKNFNHFKIILWNHRSWDFYHTLDLMKISINLIKNDIANGYEEDESKNKKVAQMERVILLLQNFVDDNFIEQAEKVYGELILHPWELKNIDKYLVQIIDNDNIEIKEHNYKIFNLATKIENEQWAELWGIIKGNKKPFIHKQCITQEESEIQNDKYNRWYNGSDSRSWWS
jgi:hypothetical protein